MTFGLSAGTLVSLGGAALGAMGSKDGGGGSQETKREPWEPAVPWLKANLQTGQNLQNFYQRNPFSDQQKIGMQNQLGMADQFQQQLMPGLMSFANQGMGQYQRQTGGAPGSGAGYGGQVRRAGLLGGPSVFTAPTMQPFGRVDWEKSNPFSQQNQVPATVAPAAPNPLANLTPEQIAKLLALIEERTGGEGISEGGMGNGGFGFGMGGVGGGGGFGATGEA